MHGLQACLYKYITVTAFRIYALCGEDATKGEVRGCTLDSHGNYIFVHGKIIELCFLSFCGNPVS